MYCTLTGITNGEIPPAIGPITGPNKGPKLKSEVANPLLSAWNRSAIIPAPMVRQPEPPNPAINRNPINVLKLGANAHPICHTQNIILPPVRTYLLPYISDKGASINGPTTYPKTKILTVKELNIRLELWNSLSANVTPGANILEASGDIKVMLASKPVSTHFFVSGKFRGISGSVWLSHPTIPFARLETGIGRGGSLARGV